MALTTVSQPLQGALYQRLQYLIAANYSGLGPQNVGQHIYTPMIGRTFQKPISGAGAAVTTPVQQFR